MYRTMLLEAFCYAACPPVRLLYGRKASSLAALEGQSSLTALKLTLSQYLNFLIWEQTVLGLSSKEGIRDRTSRQQFRQGSSPFDSGYSFCLYRLKQRCF